MKKKNIEDLLKLDPGVEQRKEVIKDVMRTQTQIETTLSALERLAT